MGLSFQVRAQDAAIVAQDGSQVTAVPATLVSNTSVEATAVSAAPVASQAVPSAPVAVAPAMTAVPVPVQVTNNTAVASDTMAKDSQVLGASGYADGATEIDSSKNSNGSGIQIFNLNNNKPEQQQVADQNTGTRADLLRRERIRQELMNESRLIEKIEEDRISTEGSRSTSIEGIQFTNASAASAAVASGNLEEVQVAAVATASAAPVAPTAMVSTSSVGNDRYSSTEFKISPMGGYRWTVDNDSIFRSENQGLAGVAVEGRLANVLGLEVSYTYGRDKLRDRRYGAFGAYGQGYGYNSYAPFVAGGYGAGFDFLGNIRSRDTHEFGANLKLGWFVGQVRPYATGGIGTRYTAYNIDNSADKAAASAMGWKRSSARMTSNVGAGLDYRLATNLSIGTRVDWQYIYGKKTDYSFGGNNIIELYGDTKNNVRASGSLQLVF
jgi:hypothetical protein